MNTLFTTENKRTLVYILIAYTFSVALRMVWVYQFADAQSMKFAGEFMINTNDGYFWAEGARDIINGISQPNDLSPVTQAASQLTAFFSRILPFTFESIIFYMSALLSSLVVVPIILIAKRVHNLEMGLIAALLGSIAWSYYNRTMVGYFDTDMLNIVLPLFLLWSVIWAVDTKEDIYLLITAFDILLYRWWYPQSYALESSFWLLLLLWTLLFERKSIYNYKLLSIMLVAMLNIDGSWRFGAIFALFYIFSQKKSEKYIYHILLLSIGAYFITGGFDPIWDKLKAYVFTTTVAKDEGGLGLHYFTVMQTVREAGHISFETFANRISGHIVTFMLSLAGYLWLLYRYKIMLFTLPMLALGFLALTGGLRFTIYAVPVLAFGMAFLISEISHRLTNSKALRYLFMSLATLAVLYPNYKHIEAYSVPTVFNAAEVEVLNKLKDIAQREDYVVAWWDYGYPIRYYSDVKTLTDGGKHSGAVNYPVSYILTRPQLQAARMARLDVEFTEKSFQPLQKGKKRFSNIEEMVKAYGLKDPQQFLKALGQNIEMPKKSRDVYIYLPLRMMDIFPTVAIFSHIDLKTGKRLQQPFFYKSTNFRQKGKDILLGDGVRLDKEKGVVHIGKQELPVKRFVKTMYDEKMQLHTEISNIHKNGLSVIFLSSYRIFLVVDESAYNSLYVQLFVLQNFDKKLFTPVILTPYAKVYRLNI